MFGAAKENGARTRDPVLRMFAAGRARGVGMGSPGGTAAGKSADRIERRADCHDHRARASAHSQARRFCESLSDRRRDVAVLPPGGLVGKSADSRSEEHTSELQSQSNLVCRLLL